jgi:predicted small metal-binding protein
MFERKGKKQLSCRDFGVDCDFVARGDTEEEVLKSASEHGCQVHNKCESSPDIKSKMRSLIRNV